jgi:hypothetical protein
MSDLLLGTVLSLLLLLLLLLLLNAALVFLVYIPRKSGLSIGSPVLHHTGYSSEWLWSLKAAATSTVLFHLTENCLWFFVLEVTLKSLQN